MRSDRPAAVLCDMDGTLVDTEPYWIESERALVAEHGGHWDSAKAHSLIGRDLRDAARILQDQGGVALPVDDVVERLLDDVIARMQQQIPWRPGARQLLTALRKADIPVALVTMSWKRLADIVVRGLPPGSFGAVITGDMVEHGKPHPQPYREAAHALGVRARDCVAIEDSPTGVQSAVAAGCRTIAVPNLVKMPQSRDYTLATSLHEIPELLGLTTPQARSRQAARSRRGPIRLIAAVVVLAAGAGVALAVRPNDPPPPLKDIPVDAWAPYWVMGDAATSLSDHGAKLHVVSPFWYAATGTTTIDYSANIIAADTTRLRDAARATGAKVVPSVADGTGKGKMAAILADVGTRAQHVKALVQLAESGYDGIDLDYEGFAFSDDYSTWETTRPNWVKFVNELADALHQRSKLLIVTIPPVYDSDRTRSSGAWVYDFKAMGKVADAVRVMAYDYSVETPGPIAPIEWVREVVRAAKDLISDDRKIVLGIPMYGRNWVTATSGTCPEGAPGRVSPTQCEVAALLSQYGITPVHDPVTAEASFTYERPDGADATACIQSREVHYMDATGVRARVDLAREERIGGVVLWAVGFDRDDSWTAITPVMRAR